MPDKPFATIDISFGSSHADLVRVEIHEALSELFTITADIVVRNQVSLSEKLGTSATVTITQDEEPDRVWNGLLTAGEFIDRTPAGWRYRLTLRPVHWFFSFSRFYAIYQDKSASDIVGLTMKRCNLPWKPATFGISREYCVQYDESDFAFMSRLMEEEGAYYYFDHSGGSHTMVVQTRNASHPKGKPSSLIFNPDARSLHYSDQHEQKDNYYILSWSESVQTGSETAVGYWDYNFTDATNLVSSQSSAKKALGQKTVNVQRFAATRDVRADVARAETQMELIESGRQSFTGTSLTPGVRCGEQIEMTDHPVDSYNTAYLLTRVRTVAHGAGFETSSGIPDDSGTWFECVRADQQWRPQHVTPRPLVHGSETAIVVGPGGGETIYTDEWGRVRVKFHWDSGVADDRSHDTTCWIRVSNFGGLGNIVLPRVGHEVIVDFLGGNPDRPIVTGRLFNSENKPIYDLPGNKTRALWRTKTYGDADAALGDDAVTLDTGNPGANELRFEDMSGKEEVFVHAQRDMNTRIRNDESHHVGHNQQTKIGLDSEREVGRDSKVKIGKNSTVEIVENESRTTKGTCDITVQKNHTVKLLADASYTTNGKNTVKVDGEDKQTYGDKSTISVGDTLSIKGNTDIQIEANTKITLKVGGNSIEISQSGVTIKGIMVSIEGQAMAEMKSPMTTVKGDGMTTIKGGIVMIN